MSADGTVDAAGRASFPATAPGARPPLLASQPEPTPETRGLVNTLVSLAPADGVLTPEQAVAWRQNLERLVKQGPQGTAAIQEFLAKNIDYDFGRRGKETLGYPSARTALFDALAQIGGPEAVTVMTSVLQTTADPREIALLARALENLEPALHRQEVLEAARQTLDFASDRKLETADVAPLFEVLQKYGDASVVTELQQVTGHWNYYGTIALAQLPDGAGIPSLVQMAQDPKTNTGVRDATLQMLAQVSDQSPEARATLLEQARLNVIPGFTWRMIAPVLAGDQVGLLNSAFEVPLALSQFSGLRTTSTSDNQHFFAVPGSLTPEQANRRSALIDELLSVTADPTASQVLQQSRILLAKRFPQLDPSPFSQ
jgi:hypothetical protein